MAEGGSLVAQEERFMLGSIGFPELLVMVIVGGFAIVGNWKIFTKAGYRGILSLTMLIPIVNVVVWFFLAFSEWPVLKELSALKQKPTPSGPLS